MGGKYYTKYSILTMSKYSGYSSTKTNQFSTIDRNSNILSTKSLEVFSPAINKSDELYTLVGHQPSLHDKAHHVPIFFI